MSADKSTSWSYAEDLPAEDEVLLHARERSFELGVTPVGPGVGAVLTVLAAASKAQTAVEIGTGAGVSGVCILRGLGPQAVLTQSRQIAQRVIPVTGALAADDQARFPVAGRRPEQLRFA